jgi:methyl-accepting chemotaxis protein
MPKNKNLIKQLYFFWLDWKLSVKVTSSIVCVTVASISALMIFSYINNVNQATEQTGDQLATLGNQVMLRVAEQINVEVEKLQVLARTPALAAMIEKANQNRAGWTTEQIATLDQAWVKHAPSIEGTVQQIAGNDISSYLRDFIESNPEEVEVFVTDINGLNVAMTDRTSDFLQSDEDWWKSTHAHGGDFVYIGSVEYDESTSTYAVNIGVPIPGSDTNKMIGVLRGTLDISNMLGSLGQINTGQSDSILLVNIDGVIQYSRSPEQIMQTIPDTIHNLLKSGQGGWAKITGTDGNSELVAYSSFDGKQSNLLGWRLVITQELTQLHQYQISNLLFSLLASLVVLGFGLFITALIINHSISMPFRLITKMAMGLSVGDLMRGLSEEEKNSVQTRRDEIGAIGQAFDCMIEYLQNMGLAATAIANQDLTSSVTPKSEKDELGNAFAKMITGLRTIIGLLDESAEAVSSAAIQLDAVAGQSSEATSQITVTIQQVATGSSKQSESVSYTIASAEPMNRIIEDIAKGAREQAKAVDTVSEITTRISAAIEQVADNAQTVARTSAEAARQSRTGAQTVKDTITSMQLIRTKVGLSAQKVAEMNSRSKEISAILETIEDIASQTNLLALNAAIEAARAGEQGKGFAVVAGEVRKLAERSSLATREIAGLVKGIRETVEEAVNAMKQSASEIEAGVLQANSAGEALEQIRLAADSVYGQAEEAGQAAANVNTAAFELVDAVDAVSAVIEENTAATKTMAAHSNGLNQAIENIASVSEQNSAAVEEVSASTEEVSAQVEEVSASAASLLEMAQQLRDIVAQFKRSFERVNPSIDDEFSQPVQMRLPTD